jgi:predicted porin
VVETDIPSDSKNVGIYKGNPMNKNILAIAIAAAVAAPSAFAAATVYGLAHVGVASQDTGVETMTNVLSNSSRLGIKGSEDLGAGLKAVYQMEFAVNMDGEGNGLATGNGTGMRNTFAGIGGGFGTVLFGKHDSPIKNVSRKYDLFGDQIGNSRNLLGGNYGSAKIGAAIDGRHNNVIAYQTPKMGGFDALLAYVPGAAHDDEKDTSVKNKGDAYSAQLNFAAGAFDASLGYINIGKTDTSSSVAGVQLVNNYEAFRLAGGYTFGAAKVVALYQNDNPGKVIGAQGTRDAFGIGGSYKVTAAGTIKAQYYSVGNVAKGVSDTGASLWNIGYDHAMSKNTTAYVSYALMDNQKAGFYSVNTSSAGSGDNITATTGKDSSAISVGMIHKF